ncbi:proton-transporting ATPase [Aureococcus anophagefferens]|nr:proton-transporting ATPase [Aureococcus anophagefferens]
MSVPEITRDVALGQYGAIDWPSFGRVGILSAADVAALKAAEDAPLDYSLGDGAAARVPRELARRAEPRPRGRARADDPARVASARTAFAAHGGVGYVTKLLKKPGHDSANAQLLYELTFCLWALSFGGGDVSADFLQCGSVAVLCDQVCAAPREKVVRVSLATLRNLADAAKDGEPGDGDAGGAAAAMIKCGLRYAAEVRSGDLAWGLVHGRTSSGATRAAEADDFALIKLLVQLLDGDRDPTVVSIACYDVGEFVRFYPNGKAVVKHLGAKDKIMALIDHEDPEIQRHALQCVSKILVTNWEFCN